MTNFQRLAAVLVFIFQIRDRWLLVGTGNGYLGYIFGLDSQLRADTVCKMDYDFEAPTYVNFAEAMDEDESEVSRYFGMEPI